MQLRLRHGWRDATDPKIEEPVESAQRVRGEDRPRRRWLARRRLPKAVENAIWDDLPPATR